MMHSIAELRARVEARGLDVGIVETYGIAPIVAHVVGLGSVAVAPWLDALEAYVAIVGTRTGSLWSAMQFVIGPLLAIAGDDATAFAALLVRTADVTARGDTRFEQYAVPVAGRVLARRPIAARAVLDGAAAITALDVEPGWFTQIIVPPLARVAVDDAAFVQAWQQLVELACTVHRGGMHPGYPLATGVAALLERGDLAVLPRWIEVLAPLARAAKDQAYGLFEYGVAGLAGGALDSSDITDALELALAMLDHGLAPGPTIGALSESLQLDIASKLAHAGVDPALVIRNGVAYFRPLGWLDDGGERLTRIAIELHRRGLRQLLFDDGLDVLIPLERDYGGLALRGLELIEHMIAHDIEPAVVMRWSLPHVLGRLRPAWAAAEVLQFAHELVTANIAPESAILWAARPLVELSATADEFRRLSAAVVAVAARLQAQGIDHREVLFHDVAQLAEAGRESQTFAELLDALAALLAAWAEAALDPTELLRDALPAAAREAAGRPWVLAIALRTATRLGREGRGREAVALLAVGVKTAAQLGGTTATGDPSALAATFEAALASLEARYAALPAALTTHASIAAGVLAGTDVEKLDRALAAIIDAHARHGAALEALASALPDLARMAGDAAGLAALADELVAIASGTVAPKCALRLAAIAAQTCRTADHGRQVLAALARWVGDADDRAETLEQLGTLGRITTPATLPSCVEIIHAAFADLSDRRRLLVELLAYARDEATLRRMCELVAPLIRDGRPGLIDGLVRAKDLVARGRLGWTHLVAPALITAKQHAGALLSVLTWLPARGVEHEADAEVVRNLITQRGVRAVDLIANLIAPALARGVIRSLGDHAALLDRYLRDVGFADADVYAHFVEIAAGADEAATTMRIAALRNEIAALVSAIRSGDIADAQRAHALFGVALQYVFPSAVSATRRMWEQLVEVMPDRPDDVRAVFAHGHAAPLEVAAGSWQLVPGTHDLAVFGWCARVLPGDAEPARTPAALGWELLAAWSEGRLAREPQQTELTRALLAHAPAGSLPAPAFDAASQLLAIRQLAADRLAALVEVAVLAARAEDGERVDRLVRTRLAPTPRIGAGLVKSVARTLADVRAGTLSTADATRRLRGQLQAFEVGDEIVERLAAAPELGPAMHELRPKHVELEPGKEVARIHAELVGQELAAMTQVIARALEYRASSDIVTIDVSVTKRKLHAPIGLTAGVCVASDVQLWSSPGFMHLALWQGDVCAGDVHLLVLEEDGIRYLALPGINPSYALLERVEADVLVRALLERTKLLAREAGLGGVWIPTSPGIHSNRRAVHEVLAAMRLPERRTHGHAFSYSPYAYRIDEVWHMEIP